MSAIYRIRQFALALSSWARREDNCDMAKLLLPTVEAFDLFQAMPRYDRRHALSVARTLWEQGHQDPDLLAAALLHDVGKSARATGALRLWHRVAVVLVRSVRPSWLVNIAQDRPGSWRRPFYVQLHHAAIGADRVRRAGGSARTVEWIRRHEDAPGQVDDPLLVALQAADGEN